MKVTAIKCKKCGDIVYSRAHYDMRWCTCESVAIDGGPEPHKFAGNREDYEIMEIHVEESESDIYDDWNDRTDKLGIIHTKKETEFLANV